MQRQRDEDTAAELLLSKQLIKMDVANFMAPTQGGVSVGVAPSKGQLRQS